MIDLLCGLVLMICGAIIFVGGVLDVGRAAGWWS